MSKLARMPGDVSNILEVFIQDSTSATGAGLTGLVFNSSGLTCYYKRDVGTASVAVSLVTITTLGTYVSGGFKAVDAVNMPGVYEFHPPNAALAAGAKSVVFFFQGAANMAPLPLEIDLSSALGTNGVDAVVADGTINLRQCSALVLAAVGNKLSGVGTGNVIVTAPDGTTTRINYTTDGSGNRTSTILSPPA